MSPTAMQTAIDPLGAFIAGGFTRTRTEANGFSLVGGRWPMPLVATRFDVLIDSGLAVVTTSRTFRNDESRSIEATITFPVPVHASLFALKVRIDDRVLDARAKRKDAAREDYEDALERGKTAVLHEEVLRGVHMLSVGHVAPGDEIEVQSSFAVALTNLQRPRDAAHSAHSRRHLWSLRAARLGCSGSRRHAAARRSDGAVLWRQRRVDRRRAGERPRKDRARRTYRSGSDRLVCARSDWPRRRWLHRHVAH